MPYPLIPYACLNNILTYCSCSYLTQEFKKIVAIHDELCTLEPDDQNDPEGRIKLKNRMFDEIVSKSKLARMIKYIYNDVVEKGRTFMRVFFQLYQLEFCVFKLYQNICNLN